MAAVRASIAALEAVDLGEGEDLEDVEGDAAGAVSPQLTPWTRPWLDELYRRWKRVALALNGINWIRT
ncbi:hypothetical protein SAMN02982917_6494 [Azospirillum oryzae]|uniref:Uncharacterized protein n=1 Tax=Azospirillum oryzae TaxID=286727 RepID=A0A1X7HL69_9PROT|nr:hypothetical protein [Azospirillum oryzae]SMF88716.1 hypothetical protein SAMN02982917_6494 [Azospirillum oryzae]